MKQCTKKQQEEVIMQEMDAVNIRVDGELPCGKSSPIIEFGCTTDFAISLSQSSMEQCSSNFTRNCMVVTSYILHIENITPLSTLQ